MYRFRTTCHAKANIDLAQQAREHIDFAQNAFFYKVRKRTQRERAFFYKECMPNPGFYRTCNGI